MEIYDSLKNRTLSHDHFTKKSNTQNQNEPFLRCWNCDFYPVNEELCRSCEFIEKGRENGM